jgi:hypothetical protein
MQYSSHNPGARFQALSETLKRLGYANENHVKLYGQEFELVNDPIVMTDSLVFVDAVERKSGRNMRVRIPINVVHMAQAQVAS